MGVQGLVSLLDTCEKIYLDIKFRKRRLVIDGNNLLYKLYFESDLDQIHGGEYGAFKDHIEQFFTTLTDCEISPYVVLDGGSDHTDKKFETLTQRAEDRIQKAHRAAELSQDEHILPHLTKIMFKQTLVRLKVPVAQCYGEADQEIAALAHEWQCPVLSIDSDFYIFNLPAGLLPISHFKWKAVQQSNSQHYIPCKSYNVSSFCTFFSIRPELLPTFAALAGNDYVKLQRTDWRIKWVQYDPKVSERPSRLRGLLFWLKSFQTPEAALRAALELMGKLSKEEKAEVLRSLLMGMEEYKLPPSNLKKFFIHGVAPPTVTEVVPDWMRLPLTRAQLSGDILDVLQLQRVNLGIPVDHKDTPSANLTSRPIRQVMYSLLQGKGKRLQLEERDRVGLQLKLIPVQPATGQSGILKKMDVNTLNQEELSVRLQVLLDTLKVTEASLECLPAQLRLPVAVTCFWMQKAEPTPDETLVKVLLIWFSNGDALRQRAALQNENNSLTIHKPKLDLAVNHSFNQWQACLKDGIHLNQLLGFPLPEPEIAHLYEGTLIHQVVQKMKTSRGLRGFLNSHNSNMKQYRTMMTVVHQFHAQKPPALSGALQATWQPLDDLSPSMQRLYLHCQDEETDTEVKSAINAQEDIYLIELLSVRTRFRTKERNNTSNNPDLARKEEFRGWDLI